MLFLALLGPFSVLAQVLLPAPDEAPILSRPANQTAPHLSVGHGLSYLVWQDNAIDGHGQGVAGQAFDAAGLPLGQTFPLSHATAGDQESPRVAALHNGAAAFAWQSGKPGLQNVFVRFRSPEGAFLTREIAVGPPSSGRTNKFNALRWVWKQNKLVRQRLSHRRVIRQISEANRDPVIAALPDGGAVVVYSGARRLMTNTTEWVPQVTWRGRRFFTNSVSRPNIVHLDWMHEILLQRFSPTGAKIGGEIVINQFRDFNQRSPSVALLSDGNLAVVWASEQEFATPLSARLEGLFNNPNSTTPPGFYGVLGQNRVVISGRIVTPDGQPLTDEFRIDGEGPAFCTTPVVQALPQAAFAVAWSRRDSVRVNAWDVYYRAFTGPTTPLAESARVNTYTTNNQVVPSLSAIGSDQMVVWTSFGQDGSATGVYGRLVSAGAPVGPELPINTRTEFAQKQPTIAADHGLFRVIWSHFSGLADGMELMVRDYTLSGAGPSLADNNNTQNTTTGSGTITGNGGSQSAPAPDTGQTSNDPSLLRLAIQAGIQKSILRWNTQPGAVYQVQTSSDLITWTNLGAERTAAQTSDSLSVAGEQTTFYRIRRIR